MNAGEFGLSYADWLNFPIGLQTTLYGRYNTPGLVIWDAFDNLDVFYNGATNISQDYTMKEPTSTKQLLIDAIIKRIVDSVQRPSTYKKDLKTIRRMEKNLSGRI